MKSFGFPVEFIEELKQKNDIVGVASKYLTLDRKGKRYWARCPFHGEKTPSFAINDVEQVYHCFGCKASGDVIKFVQEMESLDFYETVKILAEWANLEVPNISGSSHEEVQKRKREKDEMLACMKEAALYFHGNLKLPQAKEAREYLLRRGMDESIQRKFGIGFSIDFNSVIKYLNEKGFSVELQKKVGIIKEKDGRYYDALGERIIFPILNIYSEVVAFSGRTLKQHVDFAKYINTAETPIFFKGKNLFAINMVKKRKQQKPVDYIIVVEGQVDAISLYRSGFDTTVASMGTALTHDQAKLIKRFCDKVFICYDGDTAGKSATLRGLDILKNEGIEVRIMSLPEGKDPDDYIKEFGRDAFERLMGKALPLVEFRLSSIAEKYNLEEMDGKAKFAEEALEVLRGLSSEFEGQAYLEMIQKETGFSLEFLRKKLSTEKFEQNIKEVEKMPIQLKETKHEGPFIEAQQCIIASTLRQKRYASTSPKILNYLVGEYREIFEFVIDRRPGAGEFISAFSEKYEEIVGSIVNFLFVEDENLNKQLYDDCLWLVYRTYLTSRQGEITEMMKEKPSERRNLMREYNDIVQKIKNRKVEL